ncbi:hypothetical protein GCM10010329_77800 [Streptomyces spiroverticillatus]|uniref:Uncharacterized protein n=1 Tax=Streptomyces finlayi TaxID=67296 RepID=A0A918X5F1_9ACTN|nr:hypothetical protein [Streptomyces finlayi]GHA43390.1 hypothetical protein GCM10010329_77800 [Streptomyces spiroverticillatus]GHD13409.1 hypothetical protein GCM10010334_71550 [Streptomyces finlayi]
MPVPEHSPVLELLHRAAEDDLRGWGRAPAVTPLPAPDEHLLNPLHHS